MRSRLATRRASSTRPHFVLNRIEIVAASRFRMVNPEVLQWRSGGCGQGPGRRLVQLPLFLCFLLRRELLLVLFLVFLAAPVSHVVPLRLVTPARCAFENVRVLELGSVQAPSQL